MARASASLRLNRELRRANDPHVGIALLGGGARPATAEMITDIDDHKEVYGAEPISAVPPIAPSTSAQPRPGRPGLGRFATSNSRTSQGKVRPSASRRAASARRAVMRRRGPGIRRRIHRSRPPPPRWRPGAPALVQSGLTAGRRRHVVEHRGVEQPVVGAEEPADQFDEQRPGEQAVGDDAGRARPHADGEHADAEDGERRRDQVDPARRAGSPGPGRRAGWRRPNQANSPASETARRSGPPWRAPPGRASQDERDTGRTSRWSRRPSASSARAAVT